MFNGTFGRYDEYWGSIISYDITNSITLDIAIITVK